MRYLVRSVGENCVAKWQKGGSMADQIEPLICIHDLHRHYRMGNEVVRALNGVDLCIFPGEFFGICGTSGSGKSTLLYLIGGMDRPSRGKVVVDGKNLTQQDENQLAEFRCRKIGFIYQNFHLIPSLTAWQNVEIPMIFNRVARSARREVAFSLLAKVGLAERTNHRPAQLSGGQQQRVAIARALVNQPILLLADEPTGNLDSRTGQEVVALLKELASTQKVTVLMVTHDMSLIQQTDRYIRLQDGRIVEGR